MEEIEDSIKCSECNRVLETPILLPCGDSICQKHIINADHKEYCCRLCHTIIRTQERVFPINKALAKIINTRIQKIKLTSEYEYAYSSCKKLKRVVDDFNLLRQKPYHFIDQVIEPLVAETNVIREDFKRKIDAKADELVDKVRVYSNECKSKVNSLEIIKEMEGDVDAKVREMDAWRTALGYFDQSQEFLREIGVKGEACANELQARIQPFKFDFLTEKFDECQQRVKEFRQFELQSDSHQ
jgi:hypothetical protein